MQALAEDLARLEKRKEPKKRKDPGKVKTEENPTEEKRKRTRTS